MTVNGKTRAAHQVSYEVFVGSRHGLCVLHHCDNPVCVNPDHLFLGTKADNNRDRSSKGRSSRGSYHWKSSLDETEVRELRRLWESGSSTQASLSKQFEISQSQVSRIVNRKDWQHV